MGRVGEYRRIHKIGSICVTACRARRSGGKTAWSLATSLSKVYDIVPEERMKGSGVKTSVQSVGPLDCARRIY